MAINSSSGVKTQDSFRQIKETEASIIERKKEAFQIQAERETVAFLRSLKCDDVRVVNSSVNIIAEDNLLTGSIDVVCSGVRGSSFKIPITTTIENDNIKRVTAEEIDAVLPKIVEKKVVVKESTNQIENISRAKTIEAEQIESSKVNFVIAAEAKVCNELRKMGFGALKIYQESNVMLKKDSSNGFSGRVDVFVKLQDKHGDKKVRVPVTVKASSMSLPEEKILRISILKTSTGVEQLEKEIGTEIDQNIAEIEAEELKKEEAAEEVLTNLQLGPAAASLKVEAGTTTPPNVYIANTLKINKSVLPDSLKVGDIIDVDGVAYQATDSGNNNSEVGTDSVWVLKLVQTDEKADVKIGS